MQLASKLETKFLNSQLEVVRNLEIIALDEEVEEMAGMFRHSQLVMLAGVLARFLQRRYQLIVTDRRVLLVHVPAFLVHGTSGYYQYAEVARPCRISLPRPPKKEHPMGAKVMLPPPFAALVRHPFAYVVFGLDAQKAFDRAAEPSALSPKSHTIRFACEHCGQHMSIHSEFIGTHWNCPGCNTDVVVPGTSNL